MRAQSLRHGGLVVALLVAACQARQESAGPSTATPGSTPGPAPTATAGSPTDGPATTGAPQTPIPELLRLTLDASGPILTPEDGPAGARYALPAAGTRARDGRYVLVVVWFGDEQAGEPPKVTVATSRDAREWRVRETPILTALGVGPSQPGPIPSAIVELDDGSWQLYGWAADTADQSSFASWRASAPVLDGPWTLDGDRILEPGPGRSWDSQTASIGSVQRTGSGFAAWYEGQPPGFNLRGDLGYATSTEGLTWEKFDDAATTAPELAESDPVVRRGLCGVGTSMAVYQPQVELAGDGYLMVFGGFGASGERMDLFGALSTAGTHWTCGTPEPLLQASGIPGSQGIHTIASLPLGDGRVGILVESLGERRSDIWLAEVTPAD